MPCLCYLLSEGDLCAGNCCSNTSVPCDECLTRFLRRVQGTAAISGVHFLRSSALAARLGVLWGTAGRAILSAISAPPQPEGMVGLPPCMELVSPAV